MLGEGEVGMLRDGEGGWSREGGVVLGVEVGEVGVGVEADTGHGREDGLGCKDKVGEWVVGKGWAGDKCSRSDGGVQQGEGAHPTDNTVERANGMTGKRNTR